MAAARLGHAQTLSGAGDRAAAAGAVPARCRADQLGTRADIVAHVRRINAALIAWDQYETNRALPDDLRRPLAAPPVDAAVLRRLRRTLLRQLRPVGELTA